MRRTCFGSIAPTMSCWPTSTWSPSATSSRDRLEIGVRRSPRSRRPARRRSRASCRCRRCAPGRPTSEIGATPLGWRASNSSTTRGQAVGDVVTRHTTGVEGTHRELGAGLADRLGGDDADRLADVDDLAGRQRAAVAGRAGADLALAGQHAAHPDLGDAGRDQRVDEHVADVAARRADRLLADDDVLGQVARVDAGVDVVQPDERAPSEFLLRRSASSGRGRCRSPPRG